MEERKRYYHHMAITDLSQRNWISKQSSKRPPYNTGSNKGGTQLSNQTILDQHRRSRIQRNAEGQRSRSRGADFSSCQPSEIIYAANIKLKLEYTYCILAKRFRARPAYQKIRCSNIRAIDNTDKPLTGW